MSAEISRQFIDTHILIYACDVPAGEKRQQARQLLSALWESRAGRLSVQALQEFYPIR